MLQKQVIPLLKSVVDGRASTFEVNMLVKYTHQFASVRLTQILKSKKIINEVLQHSVSTIALDCIAEIFHRDSDGNFIELQHYFSGERDLEKTKDHETFINFRRIVFSKINDGIFRIYKEYDPITSKIIRNIKIIIKRSDKIYSLCRFGETYFTISPENLNETKIEMSPEKLESEFVINFPFINGLENQVLKLLEILAESNEYRRFYSLIDLALIIKNIYLNQKKIFVNNLEPDKDLIEIDLKKIINTTFNDIKVELEQKYLKNQKLDKHIFEQYFQALLQLLDDTFLKNDGVDLSHYDYLLKVKDDLSYEDYRSKHRSTFEYFVKIGKTRVINNLKEFFA